MSYAVLHPGCELGCSTCKSQHWRLMTTGHLVCGCCGQVGDPVRWTPRPPVVGTDPNSGGCGHYLFKASFDGVLTCADSSCGKAIHARWFYEPVAAA